ncbi:MAG: hypothetical protein HYY78_12905 [Betaproteobacteria bacterium]|nr:hypothetical protein [Betaproteobacteria bacterium]
MVRVYLRLAAIAVALHAAGCAELRWHKDGLVDAVLAKELAECQQVARLRAYREAWPFGLFPPYLIGMDRRGYPIAGYPDQREVERFLLEHDLVRGCMRGKGYALVPVEKP